MSQNSLEKNSGMNAQQTLNPTGHLQKEEKQAAQAAPGTQPKGRRPSREVVLKVIEVLKRV